MTTLQEQVDYVKLDAIFTYSESLRLEALYGMDRQNYIIHSVGGLPKMVFTADNLSKAYDVFLWFFTHPNLPKREPSMDFEEFATKFRQEGYVNHYGLYFEAEVKKNETDIGHSDDTTPGAGH